jgi:hypothetical protein
MEAPDLEELQLLESSRSTSEENHVQNTHDIVTTESGTELEVDELAIQEVPLQEVIHLQEETCVTIG